jgi:hypothetical protein
VPEPATQPALKPLPEYTCGVCRETFGTNFSVQDIDCGNCEARRCPYCTTWFGGEEGGTPGDDEFPASWIGGHSLVIEFGDEEFLARCQCGHPLGVCRPSDSLDKFQLPWERHVMTREGRNA